MSNVSNVIKYPVVFTGYEKYKMHNLEAYNQIGYRSEIIVKHILEQNENISSCSFVKSKENMQLGDIKVKFKGYKGYKYIEVKTGTMYQGRKKLCIDYRYTLKNCPDIEYNQSTIPPWIYSKYDTLAIVFYDEIYLVSNATILLEKVRQDVKRMRLRNANLDNDWYKMRNVEIAPGVVANINQVHRKYDTWLLSVDLDTYLDIHNIKYKKIDYEVIKPKRVE